MRYFLYFGLALLLFACSKKKQATDTVLENAQKPVLTETPKVDTDSLLFYYERTACFGQCPIFKLTVYKGGYSVYEGKNFVDRIGSYQSNGEKTSLQKIQQAAESIQYFGLDSLYDNPYMTDVPSRIVIIKNNDVKKKVVARVKAPKSLEALYQAFDVYIDEQKWKPKQ